MIYKIRYTTAPKDYDGFGTIDCGVIAKDGEKDVRWVRIDQDHLAWQEARYASGMHCCLDEKQFQSMLVIIFQRVTFRHEFAGEPIWGDAKVYEMNASQQDERRHPYTCGRNSNHRPLIATRFGWACADCSYRQNG